MYIFVYTHNNGYIYINIHESMKPITLLTGVSWKFDSQSRSC